MTHEQRQRIISRLNGRNQLDAFEAAKAIWEESDKGLERHLVLMLRNRRSPSTVPPQPMQCKSCLLHGPSGHWRV